MEHEHPESKITTARAIISIAVCKFLRRILRIMGHGGTNLPGKAALRICPNILTLTASGIRTIIVSGTNGKTTTCRLIEQGLKTSGISLFSNRSGANLLAGIITEYASNAKWNGVPKKTTAVIECDEAALKLVLDYISPEVIVLTNVFRDQLDRNGEMETLIQKINGFCKNFEGNLILNGDDPNTARLGRANEKNKNVKYFHAKPYAFATDTIFEASEGRFCPFCGEPLEYEYYQYSHIGKFSCKKCGFGDYEPYITAENIDLEKSVFTADSHEYSPQLNSIYNIYNMTAVAAAAKLYSIPEKITDNVISKYTINNGRMETFMLGDRKATLNLAKNPVGANMTLRVMNEMQTEKELLFVLNDNIADGLDVSWIWDINFSVFDRVTRVVTSGTRAHDIAVRIKCSGYPADNITVRPDLDEAVAELAKTEGRKFVIANYTAVQPTRSALKRYAEKHGGKNE